MKEKKFGSYLFLIHRYVTFFGYMAVMFFTFDAPEGVEVCRWCTS